MIWTCRLHDLTTPRGSEPTGQGTDPQTAFEAALQDADLAPLTGLRLEREEDHWAVVDPEFGVTVGTVTPENT